MRPKASGSTQKSRKLNHVKDGQNWVLFVGASLLSALSVSLGCKLKQVFDRKQEAKSNKENIKLSTKRQGACEVHTNLYHFGISEGGVDINLPKSTMAKEVDGSLPLVKLETTDHNRKFEGVVWTSPPDCLELPARPFHYSNGSDSPCFSESGSDIYIKREVIQKLRQQLNRRDDMILEMQTWVTDLQNTLKIHMAQSANLQAQVDTANRDLFDSDREMQRLRKVIADQCVAVVVSSAKSGRTWRQENGLLNGYPESISDLELHCVGGKKAKANEEKVEMLKKEIRELKEVIERKDFFLQSYKEQKVELTSKVEELQLRLASQVPNIL